MEIGHFYYIKDCYFTEFSDNKLMRNKETINGVVHDRPYFCAFVDDKTGLHWMIPISSQTTKFKRIFNEKVRKYHKCDTIAFYGVLGRSKAFLIQNMCPITEHYVNNEYLVSGTDSPVRINNLSEKKLIEKSLKVFSIHRKGIRILLVDVSAIEMKLS